MSADIPNSPRSVRRMLATRLAIAGTVIGLVAGSVAYLVGTRRVEEAAFKSALDNASHFRSPEMKQLVVTRRMDRHPDLDSFLKSTRFAGIRILDPSGEVMTEAWEGVPQTLPSAIAAHRHPLPAPGGHHHNWLAASGEDFIQVVLPLADADGPAYGYFEGVYRLDPELREAQKERVRESAAAALIAATLATLLVYPLMLRLTRRTLDLSQSLLNSNIELMLTLGSAIAKRDSDTDAHNYRVTLYSVKLAEAMRRRDDQIAALIAGAFLHDVGKIGIPDHILLKPGNLTPDEFAIMKNHVLLGLDIAAHTRWLASASDVIHYHHEKYDGSGYPSGLAGEAIPFNARLFAVADVFDALTSARPYKAAMPAEQALSILKEDSGKHFDPAIVSVFETIALPTFAEIGHADSDSLLQQMRQTLYRYFQNSQASSV